MDLGMLTEILYWHWLTLAAVLLILEFLVAGTFFLWTAIAAGAVGLVLLIYPQMPWQAQVALFLGITLACLTLWRLWHNRKANMELPSPLCAHGRKYIGQRFTLRTPIINGSGKLSIEQTLWHISGPDMDAGTRVVVRDLEGSRLKVEAEPPAGTDDTVTEHAKKA